MKRSRAQKHLYNKTNIRRHVDTSVNRQPPKPQSVGRFGADIYNTFHPPPLHSKGKNNILISCAFFLSICFERCEKLKERRGCRCFSFQEFSKKN